MERVPRISFRESVVADEVAFESGVFLLTRVRGEQLQAPIVPQANRMSHSTLAGALSRKAHRTRRILTLAIFETL